MAMQLHNENPQSIKVGKINGHFFVPAYQRGYRWGKHEVNALLDDIYLDGKRRSDENYCLQPIVVKRDSTAGHFELIDGQQRLTTLYLIYYYLQQKIGSDINLLFSLSYQTRDRSADYLRSLDPSQKDDNIDFFHMHNAYQHIASWFEETAKHTGNALGFVGWQFYGYIQNQVHVIWYDAGEIDSATLFTRLNVGRIPLTNAELIKALLLARRSGNGSPDEHMQIEIATQWDMIEQKLHEMAFWAFLTNKPGTAYPTRIEFLFDLMAKTKEGEKDRFHTFLYFKKLVDGQKDKDTREIWKRVWERYGLLLEWFEDRELYHKVGYLVAIGVGLGELIDKSTTDKPTKIEFRDFVNDRIKAFLNLNEVSARALSYDSDYRKCECLLLLFNVESVRRLKHSSERYPFHSHKAERWSLEHIHAQHPEPLTTEAQWKTWLDDSVRALEAVRLDNSGEEADKQILVKAIKAEVAGKVTGQRFTDLSYQVIKFLQPVGTEDSVHSIANLALLSSSVNSALNNASFQAKRLRVIGLDRMGSFIPICTRRVFFKYYTEAGGQQMHLWSREDQESYLNTMLSTEHGVRDYLNPASEVQS